jgi:hypothetical protein
MQNGNAITSTGLTFLKNGAIQDIEVSCGATGLVSPSSRLEDCSREMQTDHAVYAGTQALEF